MIKYINYFAGKTILTFAIIVLQFNPSFKGKLTTLKKTILTTNKNKIDLSQQLILSVIKIEDERFLIHLGIDFYSILRAMYKNITTKRIEGASTIVQQLVRNILNEREIKIKRKINEIMFAVLINKEFSKIEILSAYLETYKFNNSIGIYAFCRNENYNIEKLSAIEAAQIAARLKYPSIYKSNYTKYLKRVRTIEIKTTKPDIRSLRLRNQFYKSLHF